VTVRANLQVLTYLTHARGERESRVAIAAACMLPGCRSGTFTRSLPSLQKAAADRRGVARRAPGEYRRFAAGGRSMAGNMCDPRSRRNYWVGAGMGDLHSRLNFLGQPLPHLSMAPDRVVYARRRDSGGASGTRILSRLRGDPRRALTSPTKHRASNRVPARRRQWQSTSATTTDGRRIQQYEYR